MEHKEKVFTLVEELERLQAELKSLMANFKETQRDLISIELRLKELKMQEKVARRAEILGY